MEAGGLKRATYVHLLNIRLPDKTASVKWDSRVPSKRGQQHRDDSVKSISKERVGALSDGVIAIETFAPDLATFRRGRDFVAWLGLVPKQHSTGGKARMGKTSKMGQRDIRRLLVSGAMAVLQAVERFGIPNNG